MRNAHRLTELSLKGRIVFERRRTFWLGEGISLRPLEDDELARVVDDLEEVLRSALQMLFLRYPVAQ